MPKDVVLEFVCAFLSELPLLLLPSLYLSLFTCSALFSVTGHHTIRS